MSKEERYEIRECSRNNNTKSKYIYDNKENNSISFDKQTIINLLNKQNQQLAELKAENEKLNKENSDMHTAVNQTITETLMIKDDNTRLRTCIDNRIVELQQQLKEKDEEIETIKAFLNRTTFTKEVTKQVCEKIREKCSASLMYSTSPILPEYNAYIVPVELLDQIERGEEC